MKKEKRTAEIISVADATFVNPQGQVLSGVTRTNAPVNLGGSGDRWKVVFRFEDNTQFEGIVGMFRNINNYEVGSRGMLTVKGGEILAWEPFLQGEESEELLLPARKRKRRLKIAAAALAGALATAAAVWLLLFNLIRTPVSSVLESEDGNRVEVTVSADKLMKVHAQVHHFVVINTANAQYKVFLPTQQELDQARFEKQAEVNDPDSGVIRLGFLGNQMMTGNLYRTDAPDEEEVLYGTLIPSGTPVKITGTGKGTDIERLLRRLDFQE